MWKKIKKAISKLIDVILGNIFKPILSPVEFLIKVIRKIFDIFMKVINIILSLFEIASQLIDFFLKFVDIFIELILNIKDYIFNPFKFFIVIIQFFILFFSFLVSFLYHSFSFPADDSSLMDMKLLELVLYISVLFVTYSGCMALYFTYWFIWKLIIEYFFLYSIDQSTNGYLSSFMYRYLIACENPPNAWYMTSSWHKGNKNTKYIFAFNKCPVGYSTNNMFGLFCKQNNAYELTMCPHANLYRVEKNLNTIGHLESKVFDDTKYEYARLKPNKKNKMINEYRQRVISNNDTCNEKMKSKTNLLKSICMKTNLTNLTNLTTKNKIQFLCNNIFCTNNQEPLCQKFSHVTIDTDSNMKNNSQIIFYLFFIVIIMALAMVNFLDKPT